MKDELFIERWRFKNCLIEKLINAGLILHMLPASERRYEVMPSFIVWALT